MPVPGEQFREAVDRMAPGQAVDHLGQIRLGIEAVELGALQHGVEGSRPVAAGVIPENPKAARSSSSMKTSITRTGFSSLTYLQAMR